MKLAIMQPYFMPYVGYIQLLNHVDKFVIYDDVNYINKGWINRNRFLLNGNPHLFTIPLIKASQNKLINEIDINNSMVWQTKLLKTVELAYKKAPFYEQGINFFEHTISDKTVNISNFIYNNLEALKDLLSINTEIVKSSSLYNNKNLSGPARILDICQQEGASTYINPIGGIELYDKSSFESSGVKLKFLESEFIEYKQFKGDFQPWLSILDVLMFNDVESIKQQLTMFKEV